MGWFRRLFQGTAEKKEAGVVLRHIGEGGQFVGNVNRQNLILEREVRALEASLEERQEEASEEEVAGVEKAIREGEESGQAEADESEVSEVEQDLEEP